MRNTHGTPQDGHVGPSPSFAPSQWHSANLIEQALMPRGLPVSNSRELQRIIDLPRRPVVEGGTATAEALVEIAQRKYSLDYLLGPRACACKTIDKERSCVTRLLWVQAWALHEIATNAGLIANVPVGGGKCLDASTEVFDYKTGRRRRVDESGDVRVASFSDVLEPRNASAFPSGHKPCVEVKLRDGSSLLASTDHPVLTARGWVDAASLTVEDFAAVAREMPEPDIVTVASDEEVAFVAYMLSDGSCNAGSLGFTNMTPEVIADWTRCATALGYTVRENKSKSRARQFSLVTGVRDLGDRWSVSHSACRHCHETARRHLARGLCSSCYRRPVIRDDYDTDVFPSDPVRARWSLFGLAKTKRLHADLWGLPRRQVALFLNRFWSCDGHVSAKSLEITLASEKMIDDLRFMLVRLGIRASKAHKLAAYSKGGVTHEFDAWRIHISGENAQRFLHEVGDVLGKEAACQVLRNKLSTTRRNTNCDVVPVGEVEVGEILDELGYPPRKGRGLGHRKGWRPRSTVRDFLHPTADQYISRAKFAEFCRRWGYHGKYAHLATTDVAWERVSSVTDAGVREVFDLSVPETHNFVANGIVVHNTNVWLLSPLAMPRCRLALLFVPPSLREQIRDDYRVLREHWRVPGLVLHLENNKTWKSEARPIPQNAPGWTPGAVEPTLHVVSYSVLSGKKNSRLIENIRPDTIIADECDALKNMSSSRVLRLLTFVEKYIETRFVCGTGSIINNSIGELAHLSALALRGRSPLPTTKQVIDEWKPALDANATSPPGALIRLLGPNEDPADLRRAFRRRLVETPGFIAVGGKHVITTSSGVEVEIRIRERPAPKIPDIIDRALTLARDFCRPDSIVTGNEGEDEIMTDILEQARCVRQIASGIMLKWAFHPVRGVPQRREDVKQWYARRKAWNQELRRKMMRGETFLDSPSLCEDAAKRFYGDLPPSADMPVWESEHWEAWRDFRDKVTPTEEAHRLHSFLVDDAVKCAVEQPCIIWVVMKEFGDWMRERARELYDYDLPIYGEGSGNSILREDGKRSCVASIFSHGRGRNKLQYRFHRQHFAQSPASARMFQQVLGRLKRRGQEHDVVETTIYRHTEELADSFEQALMYAEFVKGITDESQMLLDGWEGD